MSVLEKVRPERPATEAQERRVTDEHGRRIRAGELAWRYLLLLAVLALTIGPFLWQLSTSLKGPTEDIYSSPPRFLPEHPTLHNYARVADTIPVWDYALNSLKVATANVVTNCVGSALAGYAPGPAALPRQGARQRSCSCWRCSCPSRASSSPSSPPCANSA